MIRGNLEASRAIVTPLEEERHDHSTENVLIIFLQLTSDKLS